MSWICHFGMQMNILNYVKVQSTYEEQCEKLVLSLKQLRTGGNRP